jgi:tRNA(adenine34) deaminase
MTGSQEPPESREKTGYEASFEPSMRTALELAHGALSAASGPSGQSGSGGPSYRDADVPVGAIVLRPDGTIIGRGRNRCISDRDPTAHAEIVAIRQAAATAGSWRLDHCTLVTTLEPCTMCAGALIAARIRRLVYGAPDPRAGAAGSRWDVVRDHRLGPPVEVIGGVLADQCSSLISDFFARLRSAPGLG